MHGRKVLKLLWTINWCLVYLKLRTSSLFSLTSNSSRVSIRPGYLSYLWSSPLWSLPSAQFCCNQFVAELGKKLLHLMIVFAAFQARNPPPSRKNEWNCCSWSWERGHFAQVASLARKITNKRKMWNARKMNYYWKLFCKSKVNQLLKVKLLLNRICPVDRI